MAHPYETYGSTKTPKRGTVRRIAPSHYLVYGHRGSQYLVKRVFINDGNGRARHYWQTTKVLSQRPFVESVRLDLSETKKLAVETIGHSSFGVDF